MKKQKILTKKERKALKEAKSKTQARVEFKVHNAVAEHPLVAVVVGVVESDPELNALIIANRRNECGTTVETLWRSLDHVGQGARWRFAVWLQNGDYHSWLTRDGLAVDLSNTHETDRSGHFYPAVPEMSVIQAGASVGARVAFYGDVESWADAMTAAGFGVRPSV